MSSGLYSLSELPETIAANQQCWQLVMFRNGGFALSHADHVQYLQVAKSRGRALVVGLNSDRSVRAIKPSRSDMPCRPIIPEQQQQAEALLALRAVDGVVIFDNPTATRLIEAPNPDTYVKGGNYSLDNFPEAPAVQAYETRIELVKVKILTSATAIINPILN